MLIQIALQREALVAPLAHEGLVCRVRLHVRAQVGLVGECFGADVAFEGLFSRVSANVSLQQPGAREALAAAVRALASLRMRLDVHGKGRDRDIYLVAVGALSGVTLVGGRAVDLAVTSQV